ncbi:hypothetical protein AVEN_73489-1 [Araneus ventricosus]|uniref:Uncharacterized protein n=1 Tax=Araneus ventricosus TaxID=182803 RepID=A0A4Y2L4G4_ARAVE|nr:hypothetical protein AVEN_73489-1 [Araneus ventricosus]
MGFLSEPRLMARHGDFKNGCCSNFVKWYERSGGMLFGTKNRSTPSCLNIHRSSNESLCNSSSTEASILVAVTVDGPTALVGGITGGGNTTIIVHPREVRTHLLIWRLLIHVLVVPPTGECPSQQKGNYKFSKNE